MRHISGGLDLMDQGWFRGNRPNRLLEHSNSHFRNRWLVAGNRVSSNTWSSTMAKKSPAVAFRISLESNHAITLSRCGPVCRKMVSPRDSGSTQPIRPDRCEPTEARSRDRNLVEIETDGTESAERIAG